MEEIRRKEGEYDTSFQDCVIGGCPEKERNVGMHMCMCAHTHTHTKSLPRFQLDQSHFLQSERKREHERDFPLSQGSLVTSTLLNDSEFSCLLFRKVAII